MASAHEGLVDLRCIQSRDLALVDDSYAITEIIDLIHAASGQDQGHLCVLVHLSNVPQIRGLVWAIQPDGRLYPWREPWENVYCGRYENRH